MVSVVHASPLRCTPMASGSNLCSSSSSSSVVGACASKKKSEFVDLPIPFYRIEFNVSVIVISEVLMMHNKHQLLLSCHSFYLLPDGFAIQKVLTRAGVRELVADVF